MSEKSVVKRAIKLISYMKTPDTAALFDQIDRDNEAEFGPATIDGTAHEVLDPEPEQTQPATNTAKAAPTTHAKAKPVKTRTEVEPRASREGTGKGAGSGSCTVRRPARWPAG